MHLHLVLLLIAAAYPVRLAFGGLLNRIRRPLTRQPFWTRLAGQYGGVASFVPEIWSANLLSSLKKSLVLGQPSVVNRDYEGEISQAGDTVHINSIGRPTISTYTPNSTVIAPETLTTAQRTLTIDQSKMFAFLIDDVDKRQAAGSMLPEALQEAAYGLRDLADQFLWAFYSGADSANALGTISVTSSVVTDALDKVIIPLKVKLDEANVTTEGRWLAIPPWFEGRMLGDARFIKANESGTTEGLRNGHVGRAMGFDILVSNNSPLVTGDDYAIMAGVPSAISYAEQINQVEAYRSQTAFADVMRGLHLYGGKLVRPSAIATCVASQT